MKQEKPKQKPTFAESLSNWAAQHGHKATAGAKNVDGNGSSPPHPDNRA